jgi:hypothetical protein
MQIGNCRNISHLIIQMCIRQLAKTNYEEIILEQAVISYVT